MNFQKWELFSGSPGTLKGHCCLDIFLCFYKNLQYKFTSYTTSRILNDTTRAMPLGAKCYDCSVASQKLRRFTNELRKAKEQEMKKKKKQRTLHSISN